MFRSKSHNNNILNRGHSFINRTPHTVLTITNKTGYTQIVQALSEGIQGKANCKVGCTGSVNNVRCVKIEDCNFSQQQTQTEYQKQLLIPCSITTCLLQNITKLIITRCKIKNMQFQNVGEEGKQSRQQNITIFSNLQQFDGTFNNLTQIPQFLYDCPKLVKVNICNNQISRIDNRITQLSEVKYLGLLANQIREVGAAFCFWAVQKQIGIDLQWHLNVMYACLQKQEEVSSTPASMQSTIRMGTTITQSDQHLNCDQLIPQALHPTILANPTQTYFSLIEQIPIIFNKLTNNKLVSSQIQTLVFCQHLQYLRIVEQFITEDMCDKYIDVCFTERKYAALDFIIIRKNSFRPKPTIEKDVLKERNQLQLHERIVQMPRASNKSNKQNKENKAAVRKQIKMLQSNPQKNQENQKTKDKTNQTQQSIAVLNQYSKLLIPTIMTFNLQSYKQIPLCYFYQITKDDFIWVLNQFEVVQKRKSKEQIQEVFSSPYFERIFNHAFRNQEDLEYLANNVHNKSALKKLLLFTEYRYFQNFDFANVSVLKLILRLQDFEIFQKFEARYKKFIDALFSNVPRYYSVTTIDKKVEIGSVNISKSIICQSRQGTSWKYFVSPHSKLYKYIFKQYKKYIAKQLEQHPNKNLHFPEYIPPQSLLIRNDVHDYDMLKQYEEFQASFYHKDLKLHVRHSNVDHNFSISKRIYMQVVNEASLKIRHIGKSKQKFKTNSKILNKTVICNVKPIQYDSCLDNGMSSPSMLSCARSQKQGIQTTERGKKFSKVSNISSRKINSIQVSARKQKENIPRKKKNGIIIYSSSQSHIKGFNKSKQEQVGPKTIYLDLSKNKNPLSNKANMLNQNTSGKVENLNSNEVKGDFENGSNQVECSTFDIT